MSDPMLSYQTPAQFRPTGRCTAAWISTLVLGVLHCACSVCMGFAVAMASVMINAAPGARSSVGLAFGIIAAILLYILGTGISYLVGAFRIRRGLRGWAVFAALISGVNGTLVMLMVVVGVAAFAMRHGRDPTAILGLLFYLVPAGIELTVAILLFRALRDLRGIARTT